MRCGARLIHCAERARNSFAMRELFKLFEGRDGTYWREPLDQSTMALHTYSNIISTVSVAEGDTGMSTRDRVQEAREELVCPICIETFREPRTLACQHTFCTSCLEQLARTRSSLVARARRHAEEVTIACPECRADIILPENGVNGELYNSYIIILCGCVIS